MQAIANIQTPFSQKFAIPRQGNGLSIAKGKIKFLPHIDVMQALDGIDAFSHLWILFVFHDNLAQGYKSKVRPPRLGGNKKMGVFATRSTFRPNAIGMSLVKNLGFEDKELHVSGVDLLNNTPILDIKPYLPYADIENTAQAGYAEEKPTTSLKVNFADSVYDTLDRLSTQHADYLPLLVSVLEQDPRPAYKQQQADNKVYHLALYNSDVHWQVLANQNNSNSQAPSILVTNIKIIK
ncbi:tRNA (N6-threonylcarbamoyladenosine(37)-N6)-methyltransferase TrmO [Aestuariibacter sp. P117]|uniref:tRNA (N6-threonylcarbamoyladenosine(37)-N6)-methyltransferase TrmO n=2 Tax=Glaciecola petra TaxID=3075602 RepID=A0ABU2ZTW6_9ALTE|nr:tRNA (N6-threonylcarbamoyladenosine(37)-N6)-methyltransferase TrmO [Aestuariibacter sp. P117]MDT0595851.1 tRNA (N6-threonylcarbamoyladenosine(37)-N6)-methyltransferase TrmO [Aestuariibacter sp. P117]